MATRQRGASISERNVEGVTWTADSTSEPHKRRSRRLSMNLLGTSPADVIIHTPPPMATMALGTSVSESRTTSALVGGYGAYHAGKPAAHAEPSSSPPVINTTSRSSLGANDHSSVAKVNARRSLSISAEIPLPPTGGTVSPRPHSNTTGDIPVMHPSPNRKKMWRLSTDIKARVVSSTSAGLTVSYKFVPSYTASAPSEEDVTPPVTPTTKMPSDKSPPQVAKAEKEKRLSLLDKMRMKISHTHTHPHGTAGEKEKEKTESEKDKSEAAKKANKHILKELREAEKKAMKDWAKDKDRGQIRVIGVEDHEDKDQLCFKKGDVIAVASLPSSDSAEACLYGTVLGINSSPMPFPPRCVALLSEEDPSGDFQLLQALLTRSDNIVLNAIANVGSQLDNFEDILTATLVFLELQGAALPFLVTASIKYELAATTEVHTLFRSNSFHCSFIAMFSKRISEEYLAWLIKPTVLAVVGASKSFEINPSALAEGETVEGNLKDLTTQVSELIHQISASVRTFVPLQMQVLSRELYAAVEKRWPGMGFSILTAFLFLRVFCPAVIVPEPLLGLEIPQERKRALVLVSKALQAVANGEMAASTSYMSVLNPFVAELQPRLRAFAEEMTKTTAGIHMATSIYSPDPDELRKEALTFVGGFLNANLRKIEEQMTMQQRVFPTSATDPILGVREVARRASRMSGRKHMKKERSAEKDKEKDKDGQHL